MGRSGERGGRLGHLEKAAGRRPICDLVIQAVEINASDRGPVLCDTIEQVWGAGALESHPIEGRVL